MKNLVQSIFITLSIMFLAMASAYLIAGFDKPEPILVTDYQLEEMQRLKQHCEAENPNKECILMFDYWAVNK